MSSTSTDHGRIVSEIQKKMVAASLLKSEEDRRREIFEYDEGDDPFNAKPTIDERQKRVVGTTDQTNSLLTNSQIETALTEIFHFYAQAYSLVRVNERHAVQEMRFQQFMLFARHFGLLKTIFTTEKLKLLLKKHSNYGKTLRLENFLFLVSTLSHESQARKFFSLDSLIPSLNQQTADEADKQQLYNYMNLGRPAKYRAKFQTPFKAFNCSEPVIGERKSKVIIYTFLGFNYRRFSLPELQDKAIPQPKATQSRLNSGNPRFRPAGLQQSQSAPKLTAHPVLVSWEMLSSLKASKTSIAPQNSINAASIKPAKILAKMDLSSPEDRLYLGQYLPSKVVDGVRKRVEELESIQREKDQKLIDRIGNNVSAREKKKSII